ncbi:ABC transporter ATP-binding protein [Aureibacillus halotolerans]|nr:ABC transporter ATP-binding protein [Aureibacillus halotolerans]
MNVREVTKVLHGTEVISNVSMDLRRGEIYGLIGHNGAGKTMLMKLITNLVKPTTGTIELFGEPLLESSYLFLRRLGTMIEYPVFYDRKTAFENLQLCCAYSGYHEANAVDTALEWVQLTTVKHKPVHTFSLGMKQRLGIARAIMTKPELLLLDEPMNGLDPSGIREMRDLFKMLANDYGTTLLLSSHMLSEVEQVADRVGLMKNGRLLEEKSMDTIRSKHTEFIELLTPDVKQACFVLEDQLDLFNVKHIGERTIRIYGSVKSQSEIARVLLSYGIEIESISKKYKTLDEYYHQALQVDNVAREDMDDVSGTKA